MNRTPLRRISKKRAKALIGYNEIRDDFLRQNQWCIVMERVFNKRHLATEVHHINGRIGKNLCDIESFLAVSREGHNWIHNNPAEAKKYGFIHTRAA